MDRATAARMCGMKPSEVVDVADEDAGTIITTFDGGRLIWVPDGHPDADGQTGLMWLAVPTVTDPETGEARPVVTEFPVFAQPEDGDDPMDLPPEPPPTPKRRKKTA